MPELTSAQRQYIRKRTKIVELDPSEKAGELNIIPFLDIVVNLIIFLLATVAYLLPTVQIETQLPELRRGVGGRTTEPQNNLNLNVTVAEQGVIVTGSGGKLAPGCETTGEGRVITVPKRGSDFDWDGLTECLSRVKERFPDEQQVIISADPLVEYEDIVKAMDAVRSDGNDVLFDQILLSAGVR